MMASETKIQVGKPGISAKPKRMAEPISSALGWASTCEPMSAPRLIESSELPRVTMMPAVMAMNSAGICATRPSPMVRME